MVEAIRSKEDYYMSYEKRRNTYQYTQKKENENYESINKNKRSN